MATSYSGMNLFGKQNMLLDSSRSRSSLNDLLETYRDGLQEAFDAGVSTMSAVSDVVTPYNLPYQAKPHSVTTS